MYTRQKYGNVLSLGANRGWLTSRLLKRPKRTVSCKRIYIDIWYSLSLKYLKYESIRIRSDSISLQSVNFQFSYGKNYFHFRMEKKIDKLFISIDCGQYMKLKKLLSLSSCPIRCRFSWYYLWIDVLSQSHSVSFSTFNGSVRTFRCLSDIHWPLSYRRIKYLESECNHINNWKLFFHCLA